MNRGDEGDEVEEDDSRNLDGERRRNLSPNKLSCKFGSERSAENSKVERWVSVVDGGGCQKIDWSSEGCAGGGG